MPKMCKDCGKTKSLAEFRRVELYKSSYCISCERERNRVRTAEYRKKHKQKTRKRSQRTDPKYRVGRNFAKSYLERVGKGGVFNTMGYNNKDLCNHLELLFIGDMVWDNYGSKKGNWCIDHIVSVNNGGSWELSNIRPMWFRANSIKGIKAECDITSKKCSKCGETKKIHEFHKSNSQCISCKKKINRKEYFAAYNKTRRGA